MCRRERKKVTVPKRNKKLGPVFDHVGELRFSSPYEVFDHVGRGGLVVCTVFIYGSTAHTIYVTMYIEETKTTMADCRS